MVGSSVVFEFKNLNLSEILKPIQNPAPLLDAVTEQLLNSAKDNFQNEKDPEGKAWQPSKRALAEGGQTLRDTSLLFNSLHRGSIDQNTKYVGSPLVYALIHQLGGKAGKNKATKIRKRPYLGVSKADDVAIDRLIAKFLG